MKSKRIAAIGICVLIVLVTSIAFAGLTGGSESVLMYSADGRTVRVPGYAVDVYQKAGWKDSYDAVTATMYATDGRTMTVYTDEIEEYKKEGWRESLEEVTTTMYATDGRTATVYTDEIEAYKKEGWHESLEEVTTTMYASDGHTITVYLDDVEKYEKEGWYPSYEDVSVTLYAKDGRTITVLMQDREAYLAAGWYSTPRAIDPSAPMVALTFDDGPDKEATTAVLDALEKHHAVATFFVQGKNAAAYPDQIKREVKMGMEVANHTYNHPKLTTLSVGEIQTQIQNTDTAVYNAGGVYTNLLRPPYGAYDQTVQAQAGKPLILWSIDTMDWKHLNPDRTYQSVVDKVKDGDIILMHDLYNETAIATDRIIPALQSKGFQLVTVSEMAQYKGVELKNGNLYSHIR